MDSAATPRIILKAGVSWRRPSRGGGIMTYRDTRLQAAIVRGHEILVLEMLVAEIIRVEWLASSPICQHLPAGEMLLAT